MRGPGEQYGADRAVEGGWGTHRQSLVVCPLRRRAVLFSNSFILIERAFEKKKTLVILNILFSCTKSAER